MLKLWHAKNKTPDFMFEETVLQTKKQVRSRVRVSKVRTGAQKLLATLAVAGVAFTTVGATLMVPSQDEAANANVSQLTADLLCYRDTDDSKVDREDIADRFYHNGGNRVALGSAASLGAQLGGFNSLVGGKDAFTSDPSGTGTKKSVSLKTFTDQYGFWEPAFYPWYPAYNSEGDGGDFIGTKGNQTGTGVAPQGGTNASQLYTTNPADCINIAGTFNASTANLVFMFPKMFIALATTMYIHATDMNMSEGGTLEPVGDAIETLIVGNGNTKGLKDLLFLDFLAPIVMLGAVMLIYTGIVKRQSMAAAQGAMWMVGAAAGTLIFLTNPMIVPTAVDTVVSTAETATSNALLQDTGVSREPGPDGTYTNNLSMCKAAGWERASREISCVIWYATIYTPWVSGQFGVPGEDLNRTSSSLYTGDNRGAMANWANRVAQGNSGHPLIRNGMAPNWANYQLHATSMAHPGEIENYSEIAYNRLVVNKDNASAAVWRDASSALPAAVLSAVAAIGPGAVLMSVSFLMLTYQLTMVILIIFAPVFLLMGITPGWGRRLTMRWLEMIVSLLLKRVMLILFLLVFVKVFSVIVAIPMMWILQVALVLALSWVALTQRERLTSFVTDSVNFGGSPRDLDFGGTVDGRSKAGVAFVGGLAARQAFRASRGLANRTVLAGGASAAAGAAAGGLAGGAIGGGAGTIGGAAARAGAANAIGGVTDDAGNQNRVAPPVLGPTRDAGGALPGARKDLAYAVAEKEDAVKVGDTNYGTEAAMGSEQARRNLEARLQEVSASPAERESMINIAGANGEIDASVQRRVAELTKQGKAPSGDVVKAIRQDQEEQWVGKKMEDARTKHAGIEKRTQELNNQVQQLDQEFQSTPASQRDKAFKDAYMKRKNELLNSRHELQQENRQVWSEIDNTMGVAAGKVSNNSAGTIPDRRMTEEAQQKAEARFKQAESNLETKQKKVKENDEAKELALKAGKAAAEKAYVATAAPVVNKVNEKVVKPVTQKVESGKRAVEGAKTWTGQQAHKLIGDLPPTPPSGKPTPHKPLPSGPLPPLPFPKPDKNQGR